MTSIITWTPPMNQPFVKITDAGVSFLGQRPGDDQPGKHDYQKKPVRVEVNHDLSIELHGPAFSATTQLTVDEALGIIAMLNYVVREKLHNASRPHTVFVQAGK